MTLVFHCLRVFLYEHLLPAGSATGSSAGIVFTHVPVLGTDQGEIWQGGTTSAPPCQISP